MTDERFELVFVCTGNRFRSPIAAAFAARATEGLPVTVGSRGTLELGPVPALSEALELSGEHGLDLSRHAAQAIGPGTLAGADLVVGFERMHLATAVVDGKADRDRTFTLPELVELLERRTAPETGDLDPVERARCAVADAAAARGPDFRFLSLPELADPLGQPMQVYRATAQRLREQTDRLARGLFGVEPQPPP